jgi:hypothetical protein
VGSLGSLPGYNAPLLIVWPPSENRKVDTPIGIEATPQNEEQAAENAIRLRCLLMALFGHSTCTGE